MSDPADPRPIDKIADGALAIAAVTVAALMFIPAVAVVAILAALAMIAINLPGLLRLPKMMGPAGWLTVLALAWIAASTAWAPNPSAVSIDAIGVGFVALLGIPAVILAARRPAPVEPNLIGILVVLILGAILLFDAASGSFLAHAVPDGARVFAILRIILLLLAWPAAAMLFLHYGWKEAAIWLIAAILLSIIGGGGGIAVAGIVGGAAFMLSRVSPIVGRAALFAVLIVFAVIPSVSILVMNEALMHIAREASPVFPGLEAEFAHWHQLVQAWVGNPVLGLGLGQAEGGFFPSLLIETGAPGFVFTVIAIGLIILRALPMEQDGWQGSATAGMIATAIVLAAADFGEYQTWWLGALSIAAMAAAGARKFKATSGGSLGSIFDLAREQMAEEAAAEAEEEDDGLYHFDDDYDDDEDDYDDEEDADDDEDDDDDDDDESFDDDEEEEKEWNLADPAANLPENQNGPRR